MQGFEVVSLSHHEPRTSRTVAPVLAQTSHVSAGRKGLNLAAVACKNAADKEPALLDDAVRCVLLKRWRLDSSCKAAPPGGVAWHAQD